MRKRWPLKTKWKSILAVENLETSRLHLGEPASVRRNQALELAAKQLSIPVTNLRRWVDQRSTFLPRVQTKAWRFEKGFRLLSENARVKFPEIEALLFQEFKSRRATGLKVTGIWLQVSMRNLMAKHIQTRLRAPQTQAGFVASSNGMAWSRGEKPIPSLEVLPKFFPNFVRGTLRW